MAYELTRKINNVDNLNAHVDRSQVRTVITFRNQNLLDLWENEMSGQISDGMWENSRGTEWLWRDVWLKLGDETKVEVTYSGVIKRRSFGMTKDLWDCVGYRIPIESGFENEKEAKAAWREIATAIYNAKESEEVRKWVREAEIEKKNRKISQLKDVWDEWKALENVEVSTNISSPTDLYSYASVKFNEEVRKTATGGTVKGYSYLFVHLQSDENGNFKYRIEYHSTNWYVPKGKLQAAIDAIKEFDNKMRF